jgi:AcrR family transcriptional regulator
MPKRIFTGNEKEQLRLTMLEAGFPLIKEYGMTHTTISKITETADIAKGTFYHFWKNKEEYIADLIMYRRMIMIPQLIDKDVMEGRRKLGREDARNYFKALIDEEISIYPHMTLEDEGQLIHKTEAFIPDAEKEGAITAGLLQHLDGVREDVDLLLVANLSKILVITSQAREELHEAVYEKTIDTIIESILDQIFKE